MIFQKGFRKNLSLLSLEGVMEVIDLYKNFLRKTAAYTASIGGISGMISENLFSEKYSKICCIFV